MKKRLLALILTLVVTLLCSCSLLGSVADVGAVTVVIEKDEGYDVYSVSLDKVENKSEGAFGVLETLKADGKNPLHMVCEDGGYGAYITEIGELKNSNGGYIMVYTSVQSDGYEGGPTVEYDGITLYQAGVGVSGMTIESETVILFRLEVYEY